MVTMLPEATIHHGNVGIIAYHLEMMNLDDDLHYFFETNIPVEPFKRVLAATCRTPWNVIVEGVDSSHLPRKYFLNVTFGDIADRDRARIALREAEKQS